MKGYKRGEQEGGGRRRSEAGDKWVFSGVYFREIRGRP